MSCSLFMCYLLNIFKAAPPETAVTIMPHHDNRGTVPKLSKTKQLPNTRHFYKMNEQLRLLEKGQFYETTLQRTSWALLILSFIRKKKEKE